jgi:LDH2 family malate/lactate/ureidoglycolate dehydrogenase
METLAGNLSGAGYCHDHARAIARGPEPGAPDLGHFFLAINPELFMTRDEFVRRVDRMVDEVQASELAPGVDAVLLPGEIEMRSRAVNLAAGTVPVLPSTVRRLEEHRREAGSQTRIEP